MMGHTHALTGCAAWLAAVPVLGNTELLGGHAVSLSPAQIAAGAIVCTGAAMLPDIDHHDGTIANSFGKVTQLMCEGVERITGGHRQATHSLLFAVGAGYGADWLATHYVYGWWVVLFLLIGLALDGLGLEFRERVQLSGLLNAALAAGLVYLMRDMDMRFTGYAITLGCVAHVAGDCLTPRGCPVLWPAQWRLGIPLVSRTDGSVERWVVTPLLTLGVLILAARSVLGDTAAHWLSRS